MNSRKVKAVWFHSSVTIPGIPELQTQASTQKAPGIGLELADIGLYVSRGGISGLIPIANIKSVLFETAEQEAILASKPKVRLG